MTNKIKIYSEEDMRLKVEVIENFSDAEFEKYSLKTLEVVEESLMYESPEIGEIFEVEKLRGINLIFGLWELEDVESEVEYAE